LIALINTNEVDVKPSLEKRLFYFQKVAGSPALKKASLNPEKPFFDTFNLIINR
jgi:hypothetical protein